MLNLIKYDDVSSEDLSKVVGGDKADYNMGYETGRDVRRTIDHITSWWRHKFVRTGVTYNA